MRDSSPPEPVITSVDNDSSDGSNHVEKKWNPKVLIQRAEQSHSRLPFIRKIPFRALAIIFFIAFLNVLVWIAAAIVLVSIASHSIKSR